MLWPQDQGQLERLGKKDCDLDELLSRVSVWRNDADKERNAEMESGGCRLVGISALDKAV